MPTTFRPRVKMLDAPTRDWYLVLSMLESSLPNHLSASEHAAIVKFRDAVRVLLGPDLYEIRLFGSRARGEGHEHSDVDLALIVTPNGRAQRRNVYDLAFDIGFEYGIELAPLVLEHSRLDELRLRQRLLASDLDREGICL